MISKEDVYEGLDDKLQATSKSHDRGKHRTEWNQPEAFINLLQGQSGKAIDEDIAARLEAFARDLIDTEG